MLLTVCTIAQLPQALTLGDSFKKHNPHRQFIIGLADDPTHLPVSWSSPYPMLTLADAGLLADDVAERSVRYTPTEFQASCKPAFVRAAHRQAGAEGILYMDPSGFVYHSLDELFAYITQHSVLLNPHWLKAPNDGLQPDEKHLQNVGLYSSGLVGFGPHAETERMLDWWMSRTTDRAHIDFCAGQCLDQLWLMHVPGLFNQVGILKNFSLQVAVWNLAERHLANIPAGWQVVLNTRPTPLLTADFLGLLNPNEGLFQRQNRLQVNKRPDIGTLLSIYNLSLKRHLEPDLLSVLPAYGQKPEPVLIRGWRYAASRKLQQLSHWINNVPIRPIHR